MALSCVLCPRWKFYIPINKSSKAKYRLGESNIHIYIRVNIVCLYRMCISHSRVYTSAGYTAGGAFVICVISVLSRFGQCKYLAAVIARGYKTISRASPVLYSRRVRYRFLPPPPLSRDCWTNGQWNDYCSRAAPRLLNFLWIRCLGALMCEQKKEKNLFKCSSTPCLELCNQLLGRRARLHHFWLFIHASYTTRQQAPRTTFTPKRGREVKLLTTRFILSRSLYVYYTTHPRRFLHSTRFTIIFVIYELKGWNGGVFFLQLSLLL